MKNVWKNTIFWNILRHLKKASFVDCCILVLRAVIKEEFEVFAVLVCAIWSGICKFKHSASDLEMVLNIE